MSGRKAIVDSLLTEKISAIIRANKRSAAEQAMAAAVDGGFKVIEFTLTTPSAMELITQFRAMENGLIVGAGTVMTPRATDEAVNAGAQFIVSPVFDRAVVKRCSELDVVAIPGTQTPTEMQQAHEAGADFVKLFPAPMNVEDYIRYILGPQPYLNIFPTSGVNLDNMLEVLRAGASGLGFVEPLFDPALIKRGDFGAIQQRAKQICAKLAEL